MVRFIALCLLFYNQMLCASTTAKVFRTHLKRVFIETGSYLGDGIQNAIDAGFLEIHSIELSPHYYKFCLNRFKGNRRVHLYLGDSSKMLGEVLKNIKEPVTFWLDGHYSWGDTAKGEVNTPLLFELEIIKNHPIKTHTILIDDRRQFGTVEFDYVDENAIIQKLREINPNYYLYFQDGCQKNDVLVAEIR